MKVRRTAVTKKREPILPFYSLQYAVNAKCAECKQCTPLMSTGQYYCYKFERNITLQEIFKVRYCPAFEASGYTPKPEDYGLST